MNAPTGPCTSVTPVTRRPGRIRVIFLIGFMGAGKTTVGRVLAARLGWPFEDLDDRIQSREARTIEQIFRVEGEAGFRIVEREAIRELISNLGPLPRVVALGGGSFAQPDNATLIEGLAAPVVFLDGSAEELFRRCEREGRERPLRRDAEQFSALYDERRPSYLKATCRIDTDGKDPGMIAAEVACSLGLG
ncbi:MAG TPA: shikimate kinase [Terriglobales bacterium]|nr:shikimate kinase [Terriglobales bacterium]